MLNALLKAYSWFDHPEGMKFAETYRNEHRSVGHWLFQPGAMSAFHRVTNSEEIWMIHLGRAVLHTIDAEGNYRSQILGLDLLNGEQPVITVAPSTWQAAEVHSAEAFAFGTNVCAPRFDYSSLQIAERGELIAKFPAHHGVIERLTHPRGAGE